MKKKLLIVALLMAQAMLLCGCSSVITMGYPNAGKYSAGSAQIAGTVENLEIDWVDGSVTFQYDKQNQISISETSHKALNENETVHWWLDGATLRIHYGASGVQHFDNLQKRLTVTLPEGIQLKNIRVAASSADVSADPLYADHQNLSVTSGSIQGKYAASDVSLSSTSGDMHITAAGNEIKLNCTSGSMDAVIERAGKLNANATSGDMRIQGKDVSKAILHSTSGKIDVSFLQTEELEMKTTSGGVLAQIEEAKRVTAGATSGNIDILLKRGAGFTAEIGTTSGNILCGIPSTKTGNRYTAGDGGMTLRLNATSGNITLSEY